MKRKQNSMVGAGSPSTSSPAPTAHTIDRTRDFLFAEHGRPSDPDFDFTVLREWWGEEEWDAIGRIAYEAGVIYPQNNTTPRVEQLAELPIRNENR